MNKLLKILGTKEGLLGLISETSGKISFRRSASIVVLTAIVAPDVAANGLTWPNAVVIAACLLASALTFKK